MKYLLEGQETERLKFRLLGASDFDRWERLFEADNAALFLGFDPSLPPRELCQLWFDKVHHRYKHDLGGMNVLVDKNTNLMVGQCGLLVQTVEEVERLEVGYSVLPEFWGQGFASEAAQKCKNFAFENSFTESLISIVHIDNIGSEKVARKNGMTVEKNIANYKGFPIKLFGITQEEWAQ